MPTCRYPIRLSLQQPWYWMSEEIPIDREHEMDSKPRRIVGDCAATIIDRKSRGRGKLFGGLLRRRFTDRGSNGSWNAPLFCIRRDESSCRIDSNQFSRKS